MQHEWPSSVLKPCLRGASVATAAAAYAIGTTAAAAIDPAAALFTTAGLSTTVFTAAILPAQVARLAFNS